MGEGEGGGIIQRLKDGGIDKGGSTEPDSERDRKDDFFCSSLPELLYDKKKNLQSVMNNMMN